MIEKLLSMHHIKYIISVDDCFIEQNRDEMEFAVCVKMCEDFDRFIDILSTSEENNVVSPYFDMYENGEDITPYIHTLVEQIQFKTLQKCFEECGAANSYYYTEQKGITSFLEELKNKEQIKDYRLYSSVTDARLFDAAELGMTDGAILWFLDRNFERVGESPEAGLIFAEDLVKRTDGIDKYVYILSAKSVGPSADEVDTENEFDRLLADYTTPETQSFLYYIDKDKLLTSKTDKIAKSLAQGFKRKACYELFNLYRECLSEGLDGTVAKVRNVRQQTLNYLFSHAVQDNGESFFEFIGRFVQIFHNDAYSEAISKKFAKIAKAVAYYESLLSVTPEDSGNTEQITPILKEYREIELYNTHINEQHNEVATGDIFKIDDEFYLLVSQSCDTCLRIDGNRVLKKATLLKIIDEKSTRKYSYDLSCFPNMNKPKVDFRTIKILPFEILDLCTYNSSGEAQIILKEYSEYENELDLFRINYRLRFKNVLDCLTDIDINKTALLNYWRDTTAISIEQAKEAYSKLENVDSELKKYTCCDSKLSFPVTRLCQLNELTAIDIINEYGTMLSRIGQPFDFSGKSKHHSSS